jgi:hypothetical protein
MQECGQPPSDLVQDIVPDLDLSKLGQLWVFHIFPVNHSAINVCMHVHANQSL